MLAELCIPERTETEEEQQSEPELKASESGMHPFSFTHLLLRQELQVRESSSSVLARVALARTRNNQGDATVLMNNGVLQHSSCNNTMHIASNVMPFFRGPTRPLYLKSHILVHFTTSSRSSLRTNACPYPTPGLPITHS